MKKTDEPDLRSLAMSLAAAERRDQDAKWGEQNHASSQGELDVAQAKRNADHWKIINDYRVQLDQLTWDGILLEEVWEALAETDEEKRCAELVRVAAVALAEVECILRRKRAGESSE